MRRLKELLIGSVFSCVGMIGTAQAADIGYVLAGPDVYYRSGQEVFSRLAEADGHKVSVISSEYKPSKELANVEDFVARGVDAIVLVSANAEAGTQAAQRAKDAGIPIFFLSALPTPAGYDIPTGIVSGDWAGMGRTMGAYLVKNHPGKSLALIEGVYGQGITELIRKGLDEELKADAGSTVVMAAAGNWARQDALDVTMDFIASQKNFDIVYAFNEEMMAGAIQALQEAGKIEGKVLVSNNGKELGWDWIKSGVMEASVANPPTMEADLAYQMVKAQLAGQPYPRHVYNEQPLLTKDNLEKGVPWNPDAYLAKVKSGELVVDLMKQPAITKESAFK